MNQEKNEAKKTGYVKHLVFGVIIVMLVTFVAASNIDSDDRGFSVWDGSHNGVTKAIKEHMHDPKSYEHVETKYQSVGGYLIVTTTFRGKNAFGALIKNSVTTRTDLDGNLLQILEYNK